MTSVDPAPPGRVLPAPDPFWTSGADGRLRFLRCQDCGYRNHPSTPRCPACLSTNQEWEPVSGRATLHSFTVNHHPWNPLMPTPYVIGLVEIEEQDDLRLTTNIVGCTPDEVVIGMPLQVTFEHQGAVWLPLFEPAGVAA